MKRSIILLLDRPLDGVSATKVDKEVVRKPYKNLL